LATFGCDDGSNPSYRKEFEPPIFRACGPGPSLWASLLPEEVLALPGELARVDELLDDPVFFEPFRPYFNPGWAGSPCRWKLSCG
jgi:hypothetical protein